MESELKKAKATEYSWEKQWYPVFPLAMLEGKGPEAIKLLNKDWGQNAWMVLISLADS